MRFSVLALVVALAPVTHSAKANNYTEELPPVVVHGPGGGGGGGEGGGIPNLPTVKAVPPPPGGGAGDGGIPVLPTVQAVPPPPAGGGSAPPDPKPPPKPSKVPKWFNPKLFKVMSKLCAKGPLQVKVLCWVAVTILQEEVVSVYDEAKKEWVDEKGAPTSTPAPAPPPPPAPNPPAQNPPVQNPAPPPNKPGRPKQQVE